MLLDTASLYYRAFFGMPETVTAPDGTPVNAVRGLLDTIARALGNNQIKPGNNRIKSDTRGSNGKA